MGIFETIGAVVLASVGGAISGSAAAGAAIFTVSATVATVIGVGATICTFGGIALSIIGAVKSKDFGSSSPTYKGLLQTQTDQNLPIPLLYGTCKLAGNRIWQDENYTTTVRRIVAFSEGEICGYSDVRLNDIPLSDIAGVNIGYYLGTQYQEIDPIIAGANHKERASKVGSLKPLSQPLKVVCPTFNFLAISICLSFLLVLINFNTLPIII